MQEKDTLSSNKTYVVMVKLNCNVRNIQSKLDNPYVNKFLLQIIAYSDEQ